ncbi:MAG: hypothetical protein WCT52_02615 [Candidatus Micrarchaeia archaeon]|jgi:hypothetical protein
MADEAKEEIEETHIDRLKKYRDLIKSGIRDKEATELVWPSTTANVLRNAKTKADKDQKDKDDKDAADAAKKEKGAKKD